MDCPLTFRNRLNGNWEQTSRHLEREWMLGKTRMISPGQQPRDHSTIATNKMNRKYPQDPPKGRKHDGSKQNKQQQPLNEKRTMIKENRMDFSCFSSRKFSSLKGLKIHRSKMDCASQIATQEQRSINADKTSENQSQEANHCAEDIQALDWRMRCNPNCKESNFRQHATWKLGAHWTML